MKKHAMLTMIIGGAILFVVSPVLAAGNSICGTYSDPNAGTYLVKEGILYGVGEGGVLTPEGKVYGMGEKVSGKGFTLSITAQGKVVLSWKPTGKTKAKKKTLGVGHAVKFNGHLYASLQDDADDEGETFGESEAIYEIKGNKKKGFRAVEKDKDEEEDDGTYFEPSECVTPPTETPQSGT